MLGSSLKFNLILLKAVSVYYFISLQIFDVIYKAQPVVIDELFHIPQGIAFCQWNFSYWDQKITTLPGLYLATSVYPLLDIKCSAYNLKLINLIASGVNLIIFAFLLKFIYGSNTGSQIKVIVQAISLALLPPLYFFSFVYYTDTLSLLVLLIFTTMSVVYKSYWLVFVCGALSVIMRQTNVVWVAMVFGHKILDLLIRTSRVFGNQYLNKHAIRHSIIAHNIDSSRLKKYYDLKDVLIALGYHLTTCCASLFKFLTVSDFIILFQQMSVLLGFVGFIYMNGSIVVGDKSAHQATLHLPQLLYFLLFYGVFGLPYVLGRCTSTIKLIFKNKFKVALLAIIITIVVHYNTLVHPYLLADNRHYTFYIWNRWFGRYDYAKYVTIPAYIFLLFSLYDNLKDQNCISFLLPYTVCLFLMLALQKLVDVRYFLVPYIIIRLRFVRSSYKIVVFEFLWYLAINVATFYVFFNKEITWTDFKEPQRIVW
ncbi:putative Dol-P-Glc:Glc(2)Man(9)GlcNAc(2)-PP-Dol alpha-1,2-glucosyltransferase [Pieris brassicae]|uniref:putative Dol-P-Glc:Glc(2)Man(9)GlcNAc(2)-PP-Dol alpha-1,2-glucosyltransferase n=1 Tax=Pieris brassicae TaxID=7116 RepID=UPI001E65F38C|nr:putative Dol-P-Glc:Glc(2)Man(9)GlcNAc(2)-PP-Dol alpha-1,2-glucosyltransferase [Pieris brassicae]